MKITNKLLASASALAICLSSSLGATTTNNWFAVDFETGYTANALVTNNTATGQGGAWTGSGGDASTVTNMTSPAKGMIGKIDAQGGELKWTPTNATPQTVVLIDTDVYLVGSDEAPTTVTNGVQTEVYLKNVLKPDYTIDHSVLCAHVYDTVGSSNAWVELEGVAVTNQTWVKLRIEMNYATSGQPMVSFWVDNILMEQAGTSTATSFRAMDASKTGVTSVSFMGTGYIDNFTGRLVAEAAGASYAPFTNVDDGTPVSAGFYNVSEAGLLTVDFADSLNEGADDLQYVQLTGPDNYVRTYRTSDGNAAKFDVSELASGSYSITAYYGTAPSVVPGGYKPAAEAGGEKPAAEVVDVSGTKYLRVNVKPVSGLYYTLFVGEDGVDSLTAAAASVLALPADQDDKTLVIQMPAPTTAHGVNLVKIYASDGSYAKDAAAPTP